MTKDDQEQLINDLDDAIKCLRLVALQFDELSQGDPFPRDLAQALRGVVAAVEGAGGALIDELG